MKKPRKSNDFLQFSFSNRQLDEKAQLVPIAKRRTRRYGDGIPMVNQSAMPVVFTTNFIM